MTTAGLAAMFPIARTKSSVKEGIYLGRDLFTGLPMNLETFTQGLANGKYCNIWSTRKWKVCNSKNQ